MPLLPYAIRIKRRPAPQTFTLREGEVYVSTGEIHAPRRPWSRLLRRVFPILLPWQWRMTRTRVIGPCEIRIYHAIPHAPPLSEGEWRLELPPTDPATEQRRRELEQRYRPQTGTGGSKESE